MRSTSTKVWYVKGIYCNISCSNQEVCQICVLDLAASLIKNKTWA